MYIILFAVQMVQFIFFKNKVKRIHVLLRAGRGENCGWTDTEWVFYFLAYYCI